MTTLVSIALAVRIMYALPLSKIERRVVTKCVFGETGVKSSRISLVKLQTCLNRHIANEWVFDRRGCYVNKRIVQPYHYMPGYPGETDGKCVTVLREYHSKMERR